MAQELSRRGIGASIGIATGPAYCHVIPDLTISDRPRAAVQEEMDWFQHAVAQAETEIQILQDRLVKHGSNNEAGIFEAHLLMLKDPVLTGKIRAAVEQGSTIEKAVVSATEQLAALLASMASDVFAARALDVQDVGRRLLRILLDVPDSALANIPSPSIVIAADLSPSDTASLDPQMVLGFCTAQGGLTSHSAILARTLGIPAVLALGYGLMELVSTGDPLILDGEEGLLVIHPTDETARRYLDLRQKHEQHLAEVTAGALELTMTSDGRRIEVAANIGDIESARHALANGAEGVGLLRTEFLYLAERQPPSEEQQYHTYREIFDLMAARPVIVRTLDIGGDKPPSYLLFPKEMNPFLGWRGIRVSLHNPDIFKTQIRAILRAAVGHDVSIMLPMISDVDELRHARRLLEAARVELNQQGLVYSQDVPLGIMVETPAAAVLVDLLSEESDFFSLGTNDLTQYALAVDRGNATVAGLYQPLHPAVLRLIKQAIDLAHARGKWVGMCGELAGMPKAIPILLGLGLDEFSMGPRAIPAAKHLLRSLNAERTKLIAEHALSLPTAAEIEEYMKGVLNWQE